LKDSIKEKVHGRNQQTEGYEEIDSFKDKAGRKGESNDESGKEANRRGRKVEYRKA
jgi:hypothetical protein